MSSFIRHQRRCSVSDEQPQRRLTLSSPVEELVWARVYASKFVELEAASRTVAGVVGPLPDHGEIRRERLLTAAMAAQEIADDAVRGLRDAREVRGGGDQ